MLGHYRDNRGEAVGAVAAISTRMKEGTWEKQMAHAKEMPHAKEGRREEQSKQAYQIGKAGGPRAAHRHWRPGWRAGAAYGQWRLG